MKARMTLSKIKTESGIRITVELTYVEVGSEVAKTAESLGYKKMAVDTYWGVATSPAELDRLRNPMIELFKKGLIVSGSNVQQG
jgi:hypothetical protein